MNILELCATLEHHPDLIKRLNFSVVYEVIAYDSSGYGDNRGKDFSTEADAKEYVNSFDKIDFLKFSPSIILRISTYGISKKIV